jgi:hypothetical protein
MDAEGATGGGYPNPPSEIKQLQPVAEEDIILRHATRSFRLATKRACIAERTAPTGAVHI